MAYTSVQRQEIAQIINSVEVGFGKTVSKADY